MSLEWEPWSRSRDGLQTYFEWSRSSGNL